MPGYLSEKLGVTATPERHEHSCPFCETDFACEVPFCDGLPHLMCDSCWEADAKIVPHPEGAQQVVDYLREREAVNR